MSDKDFDWASAQPVSGNAPKDFDWSSAKPVTAAAPSPSGPSIMDEAKRIGSDTLKSLAKGAIAVPEAAVGIADIPTGGAIGKLLESEHGFTPKAWKESITKTQSPELQADLAAVQAAQGFVPTVKEAVSRPATIWHAAMESLPSTIIGGGIGRAAAKAGAERAVAAGIGEGAVTAGQQVEQIRQDTPDGLLTPTQIALGAGSGAVTGLIGGGSAGFANKLGLRDVDEMLIGGVKTPVTKGMLSRVGIGALTEGALEELPQSAQEQIAQNLATGKPWYEGVGNAAAMGMLTGAGMGAGFNLPGPLTTASAQAQAQDQARQMPIKNQEAATARANAMTTETGVQHEIVPHPTVGGAFAVQPVQEEGDGAGRGGAGASGQKAGVGANLQPGNDGAGQGAAGAGLDQPGGDAGVGPGPAAAGPAVGDRQPAGAAGAGHDNGPAPVIGPLTNALTAAPRNDPNGSLQGEQTQPAPDATFSNIGAAKLASGVLDLRMDSPIDEAAHTAANSPLNDRSLASVPQQEANNAKLGHVDFQGLPVRIENPQGSVRTARPDDPVQWQSLMTEHYGYLRGTKGRDGDPVDVYVGPRVDSQKAFVIDQTIDGKFDEHKVMLGFDSLEEAKAAYYDQFQPGWQGGESIHETTVDGLKAWLKEGDTTQPFGPLTQPGTQAASTPASGAGAQSALPAEPARADGAAPLPPAGPASVQSPSAATPAAASSLRPEQPPVAPAAAPTAEPDAPAGRPSDVVASESSLSPDKDGTKNTTENAAVTPLVAENSAAGAEKTTVSPEIAQAEADKVMPPVPAVALPDVFATAEEAQQFAEDNQLAAEPAVSPDNRGYALFPKAKSFPLEKRNADAKVARLNTVLAADGVAVQAVHDLTPMQALVKSIAKRAFGTDVTYVSANKVFDGVAHGGRVFIGRDVEEGPLIATAFHETAHVMQQTNRPLAAKLERFVMSYVNGGVVEQRGALERQAAREAGVEGDLDEQGVRDEVMADINGALALDPKFWQAMAKHDESLFRRVAYKFMELLTKAVEVARGSRFDVSTMVSDVEKVRDAIARGWAQYNAERGNDKGKSNERQVKQLQRKGAGSEQAGAEAGREQRGVRGTAGVLDGASGPDTGDAPLRNLPATVKVDGRDVTFGPFQPARDAARRYMEQAGLPYRPQREYVKVDPARAQAIAAEFDAMKHDPSDPAVKASYDAMIRETIAQYQAILDTGLKIEFIDLDKTGDPYGNPRNAILDVVENNHLWVFSTRDGFGGPNATLDVSDNPLLAETAFQISGQTALANDIFRVVHDYFGHIKEGIGFRAEGEENAWQQHVRMYSKEAIPAMTSETRGQNSWVNFGPYAEHNKTASGADTEYAPQKIGLMPAWTYTAGRQFSRRLEAATNAEAAFRMAAEKTFATNREFKLHLQQRIQQAAKEAKADLTNADYLQRVVLQDAKWAITRNANAIGWYNGKLSQSLSVLSLIHPELTTDRQSRFAMTWALAVTSNGIEVNKNFELANDAYSYWKTNGVMPTDIGVGTAKSKINDSMALFNQMVQAWGIDNVERFMTTKHTVRAIQHMTGKKVTGEGMDTEVYGASIVGPKIGNGFFANLNGHYEQLTMDRWFMRSWGRWTGNLVKVDPQAVKEAAARLKNAIQSLSANDKRALQLLIGTRVTGAPTTVAQAILNASKKPDARERINGLANGGEVRLAAITLARNLDGQIEWPKSAGIRNKIRAVMQPVLEQLQQEHPALTMADLQALLWYPEKRLYDAAKTDDAVEGYEDNAAPDYANAAVRLAKKLGWSDDAINDAIRKGNGQVQDSAAGRPAAVRGGQRERAAEAVPAVRYSRRGLSAVREGAAVAVKQQQPDALAPVVGIHYGKAGDLAQLGGAFNGTGISGREQERLRFSDDARIKRRVYFYNDLGDDRLPPAEPGLGSHVYATKLGNLYDLSRDPAGVYSAIRSISNREDRLNTLEAKIVDAGYDGYTDGRMIVVLDGDVPTSYLGNQRDGVQFSRKQTETPEFKKWFGNSQIKYQPLSEQDRAALESGSDEAYDVAAKYGADLNRVFNLREYVERVAGQPKVMYHGTARDIETFVAKQASAIFVTENPRFAEDFAVMSAGWMMNHAEQLLGERTLNEAKDRAIADMKANIKMDFGYKPGGAEYYDAVAAIRFNKWADNTIAQEYMIKVLPDFMPSGPNLIPLFVKAENPWDYGRYDHRLEVGIKMGEDRGLQNIDGFAEEVADMLKSGSWEEIERWDVQKAIKALGHDSFYMKENGQRNLAVYDSRQLKSATGNLGSYDPNRAEIQFARKPPQWIAQVPGMTPDLAEKVGAWVPGKTIKQRWQEMRAGLGGKLVQSVFDQYAPIKALDLHSYILARMSKSVDGTVEAMLDYGKVGIDGNGALTVDMSGGFKRVLAQLQGEQDRFFAWVAGMRADLLKQQGRENLLDVGEIATLKALNHGQMADGSSRAILYAKINRELQAYNKSVLDVAEATGIIDGASRKVWEQQYYVPFYRLSEGDESFTPTNVAGLTNARGIVKLKGGKANLGDLMQNTVLNWNYLLSAALKNQAATFTLRNAELVGAAQQISGPVKGSVFTLDQGQKVHWLVTDDALATAVGSISFTGIRGPIIDAASAMKRALSFGVTFSPSYRVRNLIRDQLQAVAVNPMSYNIAANLANGLKLSARDTPLYAQMLAAGGLIRMGVAYEENRAAHLKRQIAKLDPSTILDTPDKIKAALGRVFDAYMETGERAEAATRMAIGKKALDDGASALEAAFLMRDSMDFSLQGSATAVRVLAQVVPFFNARLQGMYKLGRGAKDDPARFGVVLGAAAAATVALMLANAGDPDWEKREEWDRNNFWWFKIGGLAYRIPKPFEIGALATIAERGVEMVMAGMDKRSRERFAKQTMNVLMDNLSMNPVPQIVKPAIEVFANHDSFRNRPIETMGDERLSKNERSGPGTSYTARALARTINAVTEALPGGGQVLSPKQIDYLIRGYFGWLGGHLALATDYLLRPVMGAPERAARRVDDMFVIGDWVKELPSSQSRFVSEFYDQAKQVQQVIADINHYKKMGDRDKVQSLISENKELLRKKSAYTEKSQVLARINARLKQIDADTKMSAEQKRQEIDRLNTLRNTIAEKVVGATNNK